MCNRWAFLRRWFPYRYTSRPYLRLRLYGRGSLAWVRRFISIFRCSVSKIQQKDSPAPSTARTRQPRVQEQSAATEYASCIFSLILASARFSPQRWRIMSSPAFEWQAECSSRPVSISSVRRKRSCRLPVAVLSNCGRNGKSQIEVRLFFSLPGKSATQVHLWLLRWSQQNFADETLRRLRDDHLHHMSYVIRLQHLAGIFPGMRRKIRGHCPRANRADSDAVSSQVFRHALRHSQKSPFRRAVNRPTRKSVLTRQRRDIDYVPAASLDHSFCYRFAQQEHRFQVGV